MTNDRAEAGAALRMQIAGVIAALEREPATADVIGGLDGTRAILCLLDAIDVDERAGRMDAAAAKFAAIEQIVTEWGSRCVRLIAAAPWAADD
jgi:hypothetical protein